jgi:cytochrome c
MMYPGKSKIITRLTLLCVSAIALSCAGPKAPTRILVFSKTAGYHHDAIEDGQLALLRLAGEQNAVLDTTSNSHIFREDILSTYGTVVFLNTTLDVLNESEQLVFQRYIQAGGGYAGVHAASDTEYDWPWYGQLVGGYFISHPAIQEAKIVVNDGDHPASENLPAEWIRTDEWYNIRYVNPDVNVLLSVDETSYDTGKDVPKESHPVSWYHEFDGGKAFYTALGHTAESYSDPIFLDHLWSGIMWSATDPSTLDYERDGVAPQQDDFEMTVLKANLNEPMELDELPDGRILFIERRGEVWLADAASGSVVSAGSLDVYSELENGLLGMAVDPQHETNNRVYFYYSPNINEPVQYLSRFELIDDHIDLSSEQIMFRVPNQRLECCHSGGSVEFGPNGNLYLSVGDDTNPFASDGFAPIDEQPGRKQWDAQRSSANTKDLRGKILRLHPEEDGSYSIPEGNLFPADGSEGHPEIYVMGNRNPFRIAIDQRTGMLSWGEVGPDASNDSLGRGPRGHDEINRTASAGFFGWPYFIGDNKTYHEYDFSKELNGDAFVVSAPVNNSPNNTGAQQLPPAQPAFIWYPYGPSLEFPLLGDGGRTAMAGPVYYPPQVAVAGTFPAYFSGKFFIYEWMRNFIKVVTMDENGAYQYMESFLPETTLSRPVDMIFAKDGSMYLLEYGSNWNTRNEDARLSHIRYQPK